MKCGTQWDDSARGRQCEICDRTYCVTCKKICMVKSQHRTWACKHGQGCKLPNKATVLRVDIVSTAISILRDFNLNAIQSACSFDGLENVSTVAVDLYPIRDRVNDTYIMEMKIEELRALRLSKCTHITDATLKHLEHQGSLRYLNIRGCSKLNNDAIETLQARCSYLDQLKRDDSSALIKTFTAATIGGDKSVANAASLNLKKTIMNRTKNFVPSAFKSRFFGGSSS